ncbi:MAG TPA: 16S rRNA (cytidine(1402)-2'-O)-methyltransferase, partial [Candidatus Pelagibacter bacterium]|nr:16S rRNA (cytidine(1402)-2'-O)-methyltransferase [Candidatus Pelagibacter bacterium]
ELNKLFNSITNINCSIVFFISPKKINKIVDLIKKYFFNRNILICREITKFHEEYIRSRVKNLSEISISTKGEATVVISEDSNLKKNYLKLEESDKKKISRLIKKMTIKNIVREINKDKKFPKKIIYDYCLKLKNEN